MTTLESIGFTIAGGTAVFFVSFGLFGLAVSNRHPFIAPRCTARPPDVIYNPNPKHSSQARGNPMTGWIPWTLSLTYDTMLKGVAGTGTREGGLSGSMLRATLDGVVLIRFHAMCLRICALATLLFIVVLMPIYLSAQCYRLSEDEVTNHPGCASVDYNLTNYERTTLANVPSLVDAEAYETIVNTGHNGILARLYAVCFCFWILCGYVCSQLRSEWIQILAMRRVYFLEADVWGERREELKQTMLYEENAKRMRQRKQHFTFDEGEVYLPIEKEKDPELHLTKRDPWVPHPEQRDTVPNVPLYSLLVGGLPSLPDQAAEAFDTEATINFSKRESIDWQLSITATFFDHCVPNQPGFSSSVAAVTIIPGAQEISRAWKKWKAAAKKLRRLRFIRQEISDRRHYDIHVGDEDHGPAEESQIMRDLELGEEEIVLDETPKVYADSTRNKEYYRQVLGASIDEGDEEGRQIFEAMNFGPEQTAVYSREFAQAAAACCPNGCFEGKIRRAKIDDLLVMELEAAAEVHNANLALKKAREKVTLTEHIREPEVATPPPKNVSTNNEKASSTLLPPTTGKKHRRVKSLEFAHMPGDLGLESELYAKSASSNWEGGGRASDSASKPQTEKQMSTISEETNKMDASKTASLRPDAQPTSGAAAGVLLPSNFEPEVDPVGVAPRNSWQQVEAIVSEARQSERSSITSGKWTWPSLRSVFGRTKTGVGEVTNWAKAQTAGAVEDLSRESTYAVVTFTSRQAAVAARNCLADGRGADRWVALPDLPIAPLADASTCDPCACRNCCRPVTLSINDRQKACRNYCAIALLSVIYVFYTIPLTAASALVDPGKLDELFPQLADWTEKLGGLQVTNLVSGFMTALIWSVFFALCPIMFKSIANCGSKATSVAFAEFKALQYYWWFMVLTAFSGQLLANMFLEGLNDGLKLGSEFRSVLRAIAETVPSTISASWLNWIIFRLLIILPLNYLLQVNTFLFSMFGMKCCSRLVRGGGPGGPLPYRIYVDSGVVFMCAVALAPASPLVAVACFFYFLFCVPLLRRNVLFMHRPAFDGGGLRWPFIFDMCISALLVGELLLSVQMALKTAFGPAIVAGVTVVPTILFYHDCKRRYLRSFKDAALLQTSLLDGWDLTEETSMGQREEFRRFLVDAHKAAYVPVCVAGTDTDDYLTAEPAVVVPDERDTDYAEPAFQEIADEPLHSQGQPEIVPTPELLPAARRSSQHGAMLRRAVNTLAAQRRRGSSMGSDYFNSFKEEDFSTASPFERSTSGRDLFQKRD